MYIITSNSKLQTPFEMPGTEGQSPSILPHRKSDFHSTLIPEDPYQNHRASTMKSPVDDLQNSFNSETDVEILDPKKQDVEIVDPKRDIPDREFPGHEEEDEKQTPEKTVPQAEKYFLIDEEGDIIREP
jgi:hypothetical protein